MLFSLAIILLLGLCAGALFARLRLPALMGMLLAGIAIGPHALNLIDDSLLAISADIRRIALIVILMRAGLSLNLDDLKRVGRPAVLMCFVPATFEVLGMVLLAPRLLGLSLVDAAVLGAVIGAVSPAVIVPKMLRLMETGWGTDKRIPQLLLAGASVDDVYVIVLFSVFTGLAQTGSASPAAFARIPVSIALGIAAGVALGLICARFFARFHIRDTVKVALLLSFAFLLASFEDAYSAVIPFSAMLAVMGAGIALQRARPAVAARLCVRLSRLWVICEVLLFVLVGATVDMRYALAAGPSAALLILCVLLFRMAGVCLCLLKTPLTRRERLFCMIAFLPKATVQAAIGGLPLAMGLSCGDIVLTVAVLSILITAPLGALLIDITYPRLLTLSDAAPGGQETA